MRDAEAIKPGRQVLHGDAHLDNPGRCAGPEVADYGDCEGPADDDESRNIGKQQLACRSLWNDEGTGLDAARGGANSRLRRREQMPVAAHKYQQCYLHY